MAMDYQTIQNDSNITYITRLGSIKSTETCASNEWKLGSFALVNIATFFAAFLSQRTSLHRIARDFLWHSHPWCWFFKGALIAALQLLANWFNTFLVQKTPGYEDVPVIQLMLLWCSMPRLAWLTILLIGVQPFEAMNISAAASSLFAEIILQFVSSYYMVMTVNYGREHGFYFGGLERAERRIPAKIMYAGALIWLFIISLALVQSMRAIRKMKRLTGSGSLDLPKWQRGKQTISNIAEELMAQLNERCTRLREQLAHSWIDKSRGSEETRLTSSEGGDYVVYGTFSIKVQNNWVSQKASVELYAATVVSMLLLWIAQWLFWGGFIGLSSESTYSYTCPVYIS
jgi:hypothetical protein